MKESPHYSRHTPCQAYDVLNLLVITAKKLRVLEHLSDAEKHRAADAVEILKIIQTASKRKKYKLFLCNVLDKYGAHMILLCALALRQVRVVDMKNCDRKSLMSIMENHVEFDYFIIQSLAIEHHIPESIHGGFYFSLVGQS